MGFCLGFRLGFSGAGLLLCPNTDLELLRPPFGLNFVTSQSFSSLAYSLSFVGEDGTVWMLLLLPFLCTRQGCAASPPTCFWGNCGTPAPWVCSWQERGAAAAVVAFHH